MFSHFILPTFNKSTPNKVHNNLDVTGQNTVSNSTWIGNISAIATEFTPATVDGEYGFVIRIDDIGKNGVMMIGVTPMETFDSSKQSCPGWNGMTGCALNPGNGNYNPGDSPNIIDDKISKKAKEIIVVVTIVNNGAQKLIRWIVDGTSTDILDCTAHCIGNKLFPFVTLYGQHSRVTSIPINAVTIRNDEINKLIGKFLTQSSISQGGAAAAANGNNRQQPSSAAIAQLQQEFEKERNRADLAEKQLQNEKKVSVSLTIELQQKDQQLSQEKQDSYSKDQQIQRKDTQLQQQSSEIAQLKQQLLTLQSQLNNNGNSLVPSSPFVKDKPYQIDFVANGITPPADPNAFGTLLKLPSQNNSVLFQHVKNELWKKLGTFLPSQKPVTDFTLESIEAIFSDIATLEGRMRRLQQLRTQSGNFFNPPTGAFSAEQLQTLISLRDQFLPRSSNADPKSPNLINVFHGTKVDRLQSVVHGLVAVRSTDAGYFGSGVYTTTSIEYASKYARGDFDANNGPYPPRASDGCVPVVWCVAAVGVCYPLTREVDYSKKRIHDGMGVSDFFGAPLTPGYDCHCVAVNESVGFQAVPRKDMQYMEVVFDQEAQVLPIAVLWVKSM